VVPPLYQFRVRSRIFAGTAACGRSRPDGAQGGAADALLAELDRLDARAARVRVPLGYTDQLYALRGHIDLVRERLRKANPAA